VELRRRDAGDADGAAEQARLLDAVLPRGRVDDEQRLMRRTVELLGDHPTHLRQLLHQVRLRVQASRGVDDDDVTAAVGRELDRVVGDGGRIAAALAADEVRSGAIGPDLELLLSGGAERVGRAEDDRATVLSESVRELADRRRLAGAVDAHDEDDARPPVEGELPRLAEQSGGLVDQGLAEIAELATRFESPDELGSRWNADVRGDQRLLQPLPRRVVGRVESSRRDLLGQRPAALAERVAQSGEEPARLRARLFPGDVRVAE